MATNTPPQQQPTTKKEEMWFIQLAKSKIVRAFAVSCELILFLGGLWVTLTVNEPDAIKWAIGPIVLNTVVMTAMGWAVDAALGESWLHVVIQHVKQEKGMESWSKAVAAGISLLFAANIVYALVARDADQTTQATGLNTTTIILFVLTALRIFIGFTYITVRECQGWITRHNAEIAAQSTPPALPAVDVNELVQKAMDDFQATFNQQLAELGSSQKQSLDLFRIEQQRLLGKVQDIEASVPAFDYEAIVTAMMPHLKATFQNQARAITEEVQGHGKAILEEGQRPGPQRQLEARATGSQPALKLLNRARPEPEARANGTPEERLQAAYEVLAESNQRISGRALAKLAHVSRDTAGEWLAEVKGQQEEPDPETVIEADCEIEAIAQGQ